MRARHYTELIPISVPGIEETTQGLIVRRMFDDVTGATDAMLDVFEIEPGGHSELHQHPWDHQVFVVSGRGEVRGLGESVEFGPEDVIFIEPDDDHQFVNTGSEPVIFVCSVPKATLTAYYIEQAGEAGK